MIEFKKTYKVLKRQSFSKDEYSIVPIRYQDRTKIMEWRNEQIYHLRQSKFLTSEDQDKYFKEVVSTLFDEEKPNQILFSYLKNDECIGYGGLVHINWLDKHAEISFIMKTELEKGEFENHWEIFLSLIEEVAFGQLDLHKIFTYAFDIRPKLYLVLESSGFKKEAELQEHCLIDGKYLSVIIHSKIRKNMVLRKLKKEDLDITFKWVNDHTIRAFSYNQSQISKKDHDKWLLSKLESKECEYYILTKNDIAVGSIRFDIEDNDAAKISYLIDPEFTGQGLGSFILDRGTQLISQERPTIKSIYGFAFKENIASIRIFNKLGFKEVFSDKSSIKYRKILK